MKKYLGGLKRERVRRGYVRNLKNNNTVTDEEYLQQVYQ